MASISVDAGAKSEVYNEENEGRIMELQYLHQILQIHRHLLERRAELGW